MFKQHEFESAMYRTLEYGDETYLAQANGQSVGYYSQMLNPDDPRESIWFRAARDFYNLITKNPEVGCEALQEFNAFARRAIPGDSSLCVESTRRKVKQELMEADLAEVEGQSLDDQIKEHEDAIVALNELVAAKKGSVREFASKAIEVRVNGTVGGKQR